MTSIKEGGIINAMFQTLSICKWMGNDAIVGNPNSASLRLRGTGKREGGEKTQPWSTSNPIHLLGEMAILLIPFPHFGILEHKLETGSRYTLSLLLPDYTLIIGGWDGSNYFDTVEVVRQDSTYPVPTCLKTLGNFPTTIRGAVGTTFGMYKRA